METIRPGIFNILDLYQNEHYDVTLALELPITGDPYIIAGSEVFMQIKENRKQHPIVTLTLDTGLSIVGDNRLRIFISKAQTVKLSADLYQYDILFVMDEGNKPRYLFKGQITPIHTLTRVPTT